MFTKASRATRYGSIFTNQVDKIMKTAKYIVIDIETLGRRNDAAVTQVGTVIADENFDVLDSYLIQVTPDGWVKNKRNDKDPEVFIHCGVIKGDWILTDVDEEPFPFDKIYNNYTFVDGTPFGVKMEE